MKHIRKWYAKRRMKSYMLEVWKLELEDTYEDDVERMNDNLQMIEKVRDLKTYEETLDMFADMISDVNRRGYEAVREVVSVLIES